MRGQELPPTAAGWQVAEKWQAEACARRPRRPAVWPGQERSQPRAEVALLPEIPHVFKRGFVRPLISRLANLSFSQDHWLDEIERIFTVGKIPGLPSAN